MSAPATPRPTVTDGDLARGAGTALLSRLGTAIEVVAQPAYVFMFGIATYGLYSVLWAAVNLVENIADLGMTSALQRTVPQARDEAEAVATLRAALLLGILPCVAVAAIASLMAPAIAGLVNVAIADRPRLATGIALFAWALPLWAVVEIVTSAVRARRAFGPEIRLRLVWEQLIRLVLATVLHLAGVDTLGLLIAHLLSLTLTAIMSVRLLGRYYDLRMLVRPGGARPMLHDTLLAGLSILPSNIVARLFGDAPVIVLNAWLPGAAGATAAGVYTIARKLSSLVQAVRMGFSYVMAPLASAVIRHDRAQVAALYGFATRLSMVLAWPIATAIAAGGSHVLKPFGHDAGAAAALLLPLVVARAFEATGGAAAAVQQVGSARHQPVVSSLAGIGIAAVLTVLLLPPLGALGISIAVAVGLSLSSAFTIGQLLIHDRLSPFAPPFARTAIVTMASCAIGGLAIQAVPPMPTAPGLAIVVVLLLVNLWCAVRFALGLADRSALGKFGRTLRLLPAT